MYRRRAADLIFPNDEPGADRKDHATNKISLLLNYSMFKSSLTKLLLSDR